MSEATLAKDIRDRTIDDGVTDCDVCSTPSYNCIRYPHADFERIAKRGFFPFKDRLAAKQDEWLLCSECDEKTARYEGARFAMRVGILAILLTVLCSFFLFVLVVPATNPALVAARGDDQIVKALKTRRVEMEMIAIVLVSTVLSSFWSLRIARSEGTAEEQKRTAARLPRQRERLTLPEAMIFLEKNFTRGIERELEPQHRIAIAEIMRIAGENQLAGRGTVPIYHHGAMIAAGMASLILAMRFNEDYRGFIVAPSKNAVTVFFARGMGSLATRCGKTFVNGDDIRAQDRHAAMLRHLLGDSQNIAVISEAVLKELRAGTASPNELSSMNCVLRVGPDGVSVYAGKNAVAVTGVEAVT